MSTKRKLLYGLCCLLVLLFPVFSEAKSKGGATHHHRRRRISNSLYFGGEYIFSGLPRMDTGGGYLGVETNFGIPYFSLLNTVGVGYTRVASEHNSLVHRDASDAVGMYYTVGMRVYLGISYVFIDLNAGVGGYVGYAKHKDSEVLFVGAVELGFNIPLARGIRLQLLASAGTPLGIGFQAKAGLEFRL